VSAKVAVRTQKTLLDDGVDAANRGHRYDSPEGKSGDVEYRSLERRVADLLTSLVKNVVVNDVDGW
jgi:hypothetical protein